MEGSTPKLLIRWRLELAGSDEGRKSKRGLISGVTIAKNTANDTHRLNDADRILRA